jgi:hypothetical protein
MMALLGLVALGLVLLPRSVTQRIRVSVAPVCAPLQDVLGGWSLDISGDPSTHGETAGGPGETARLRQDLQTLENALAEATARLSESERRIQDLSRIRRGLNGLPVQIIPGRFVPLSVAGDPVGGRLNEGARQGIPKGGVVVSRRLDRGAREALARGEPVLAAAGLVGTIDEVGPLTSTVRLITHPKSSLMVQVIARRRNQWLAGPGGVANGAGDGRTLKVLCIPRGADVQPGDFLVTSPSQEATLPPYLIVGRITRAELKPAAPFYDVEAEPRVPPDEVHEVYVLAPAAK